MIGLLFNTKLILYTNILKFIAVISSPTNSTVPCEAVSPSPCGKPKNVPCGKASTIGPPRGNANTIGPPCENANTIGPPSGNANTIGLPCGKASPIRLPCGKEAVAKDSECSICKHTKVIVRKNVKVCKCKPFCKCVTCTSKNPRSTYILIFLTLYVHYFYRFSLVVLYSVTRRLLLQ